MPVDVNFKSRPVVAAFVGFTKVTEPEVKLKVPDVPLTSKAFEDAPKADAPVKVG